MQNNDKQGSRNGQLSWVSMVEKRYMGDIPKVADKLKYRVLGKGIDRPTWIYLRPEEVKVKTAKYAVKGQKLELDQYDN